MHPSGTLRKEQSRFCCGTRESVTGTQPLPLMRRYAPLMKYIFPTRALLLTGCLLVLVGSSVGQAGLFAAMNRSSQTAIPNSQAAPQSEPTTLPVGTHLLMKLV